MMDITLTGTTLSSSGRVSLRVILPKVFFPGLFLTFPPYAPPVRAGRALNLSAACGFFLEFAAVGIGREKS